VAALLIPGRHIPVIAEVLAVGPRVTFRIENRQRKRHAGDGLVCMVGEGQLQLWDGLATRVVIAQIESIETDGAL